MKSFFYQIKRYLCLMFHRNMTIFEFAGNKVGFCNNCQYYVKRFK